MLTIGLKRLKIVWNAKSFRAGLLNPDLPKDLLEKLEAFLEIGIKLEWEFPGLIREEFSDLVEDIESFNPQFRKSSSSKGKRVTASNIEKSLKLK